MNARPDQLREEHLTLEQKKAKLGWGFRLRQWLVSWLMDDVHLQKVHFGTNTITMGPGGSDVVSWSGSQAALDSGDIGMDVVDANNGYPVGWRAGASARLIYDDDAIRVDGTNAFGANQPMGNNKLTGLADGTDANDAVNKGQLDSAVAGLAWQSPVAAKDYLGTRTIAEIDALTPSDGQTVVAGSAGTPAATGSDTLAIGDVAEYQGASLGWQIIVANSGGFVPADTRLLVADETVTLFAPLTDGTDESDIATFDGTSNTPSSITVAVDGWALLVNGEGSVNENTQWVHDTSPSVVWLQFGGTSTAHSSLTGLTTGDDHTQYALLAGRSGGQTLIGGTASGNNLTLQSNTSDDGNVVLKSGTDLRMAGNNEFRPDTDNTGSVGVSGGRFAAVYAATVVSGDHVFHDVENDWAYRVKETSTGLAMYNEKTGEYMGDIVLRKQGVISRALAAIGL